MPLAYHVSSLIIIKAWISQDDCGSELLPPVDLQCETLDNGDLKVKIVGSKNVPKVYIGMHNMLEESEKVLNNVSLN